MLTSVYLYYKIILSCDMIIYYRQNYIWILAIQEGERKRITCLDYIKSYIKL